MGSQGFCYNLPTMHVMSRNQLYAASWIVWE